ncbi:DUF2147 domain-containing protein [Acidiphilium sp. AL]|uniref:DUF2147 domain-containing protein n=1 Tax=Acidiphilium sp. AL TaxID=2871704 RepID=UPI0021CB46F6|nr:DUF2147 domain-containing protein [Acidiphilium sp. AL]
MRRIALIVLTMTGMLWASLALAALPRSPEGDWLTGRGGAVVRIAPCAGGTGLCGHIVGIVLDHGDAMPMDWQGRSQCGFELIRPSVTRSGAEWHGRIVDPRNGSAYHAEFQVTRTGELALRGYLGLPVFGETQHWMRYEGTVPRSCRIDRAQTAGSEVRTNNTGRPGQ